MKIAFLGLGLMGTRMARNLIAAGHTLTVWNRSIEKATPLAEVGATVVKTPAQAVAGAELIVTMLENGSIVEKVLFDSGADVAMNRGAIVADMSSIKPAEAQAHAKRLATRGVLHLDAPVSGGTTGAQEASLAIMVGGDTKAFAAAEPAFRAMGRPVLVGPSGSGQLAKLANQIIVGATIGAVGEAMLIAARGGANLAKLREALRGGFAESRILELHGQRLVDRDFTVHGRSVNQLKDLDNALDAGSQLDINELPYTELTADLYRGLLENVGDLDHSALIVELERRNAIAGS